MCLALIERWLCTFHASVTQTAVLIPKMIQVPKGYVIRIIRVVQFLKFCRKIVGRVKFLGLA